tara:strand:- start:472 stop:819 length:348 start_codon:yes stop_codon:yes gene_type:complete
VRTFKQYITEDWWDAIDDYIPFTDAWIQKRTALGTEKNPYGQVVPTQLQSELDSKIQPTVGTTNTRKARPGDPEYISTSQWFEDEGIYDEPSDKQIQQDIEDGIRDEYGRIKNVL